MKVRFNKLAAENINNIRELILNDTVLLSRKLMAELEKGLIASKDITLLKFLNDGLPVLDGCENSEYESFNNSFHPEDYMDFEGQHNYFELAINCGKKLASIIKNQLPERRFRIIITYSKGVVEENEIIIYESSTVRFYEVRDACEELMHWDSLEEIKQSIVEIEIK